jgi:hypothetical protein
VSCIELFDPVAVLDVTTAVRVDPPNAKAHLLAFHLPTRLKATISEIPISDVGNSRRVKYSVKQRLIIHNQDSEPFRRHHESPFANAADDEVGSKRYMIHGSVRR